MGQKNNNYQDLIVITNEKGDMIYKSDFGKKTSPLLFLLAYASLDNKSECYDEFAVFTYETITGHRIIFVSDRNNERKARDMLKVVNEILLGIIHEPYFFDDCIISKSVDTRLMLTDKIVSSYKMVFMDYL